MSEDPSQVDNLTLIRSCQRDLGEADNHLRAFFDWFRQSQITLYELADRITRPKKVYYKSYVAGPKPMGQRHFICHECVAIPDCPTLKDEVWFSMEGVHQKTLLCIGCTERLLGRRLTVEDLRDCPGNSFSFLLHDRLIGAETQQSFLIPSP